jgi:uncharacterized protein YggE
MRKILTLTAFTTAAVCAASAQQTAQVQLKIEPANRTLTISAKERVTVDPDLAILHIGFETQPSDAKTAYATGAKSSNDIVAALKQAGIPETSIRSESQHLDSANGKPHKFKLVQQWTVKTPPERAAEILDIAVAAGATDSGQIDWTVLDVRALENSALVQAAARAMANASVLANGMGVHLGVLLHVTNEIYAPEPSVAYDYNNGNNASQAEYITVPHALAIEPRKVSRLANVYAVFAIE